MWHRLFFTFYRIHSSHSPSHSLNVEGIHFPCAAQSSESAAASEKKDSEHAEVSSEAWASKDQEGRTHAVLDDSDELDRRGQEDESVPGGHSTHTDEASASGETARENIDRTRNEMRAGKARSPQAGT